MMENQETLPVIRKTIIVDAPIEQVWEAVSTSDGIVEWWMPSTFEPTLGKEFVLHAGPYGDSPCKVTELVPRNRVGFDWRKDWHYIIRIATVSRGENGVYSHLFGLEC
ncbi:SRPBCC domain-containing protein [Lederbergia sp. NSJ-179]|uniref:SRPBCC domain-containing protein n=1 Tax=Lederbergia sp. NSJ-179 TaxID=2931402 RepID=UPI0037BEB7AA